MSDTILNYEHQQHVSSAFQHVAELQGRAASYAIANEEDRGRPFIMLRPRIFPEGNQWCVLYGENLQEGVCGFGDTPEKASYDFDRNFHGQTLLSNADKSAQLLKEKLSQPNNGFISIEEAKLEVPSE